MNEAVRKSVCCDLDGVLAKYDGWKGIHHIGDPIEGAVEFTKRLQKLAKVIIYTTRCKTYPEGVQGPRTDQEPSRDSPEQLQGIVKEWLDKHGFVYDEIYIGQGKPFALCYIDDRNIVCRPQEHVFYFEHALFSLRRFLGEVI